METRLFLGTLILTILWMLSSGFYVQPELPSFFNSPGSFAVLENTSFVLSCTLLSREVQGGLPRPLIQWLHNGTEMIEDYEGGVVISTISNSTTITSQLQVRSPLPQHAGYYQCLAHDGMDASLCASGMPHPCISMDTLSDTGWVYVIPRNGHPHTVVEVQIAESAILGCGSDYLHHSMPIKWLKDGIPLTDSFTEFLLMNKDVMINGEENGTVAVYECFVLVEMEMILYRSYEVITTEPGNSSDTTVTLSTVNSILHPNQTIQLACLVAHRNVSDEADVSWTRGNSASIEKGVTSFSGRVLNLGGATANDTGTYCCSVEESHSCVYVTIATAEAHQSLSSEPLAVFIQYKQQNTHSVSLSCPIPHSIPLVSWFRNGIELDNETEHTISRNSDDPHQLYGVYQCSMAGQYRHGSDRHVHTVARVLPYGIANPVKGLQHRQYLSPSSPLSITVDILVLWAEPEYRGNLSSLQYRVTLNDHMSFLARETHYRLTVQRDSHNIVEVAVIDGGHADVSTAKRNIIWSDNDCDFHTFYPPKINNMTCSSGAVEIHYQFDTEENSVFNFLSDFSAPKIYYFFGGCRDEENQIIYQVNYDADNASSYFFQGGMAFKAGTWCTVKAGNTPISAPSKCLDGRYIQYSNYNSCFVYATVGFEYSEYIVDESSGHVQVCVHSKGYGFNLTISSYSTNPAVARLDSTELVFDSVMITTRCVDIAITDDDILRDNNDTLLQLTVATSNHYVVMTINETLITILENDSVVVELDNSSYTVQDGENVFSACVTLVGKLEKNISVTITTQDGSAKVGVDFSPLSESIIFGAHSLTNRSCVSILIYRHNFNEEESTSKMFALVLNTSSHGVLVRDTTSNVTIISRRRSTTFGTSSVVWILVGVMIGVVAVAVLVVMLLLAGSHFCLERLNMKERVMDTNFRRRPLMEPYEGLPPSSWPDPVALNVIFSVPQDSDKHSDICNLDPYEAYPTTAVVDGNGSSESATISPMVSASTIGGSSTTTSCIDRRSSSQCRSDTSNSMLDEYINLFATEGKLEAAMELTGKGLNFSRKVSEDVSAVKIEFKEEREANLDGSTVDSSLSPVVERPWSVECQTAITSNFRIGTKIVDQDSGFDMQDTSGMSFVQDQQSCSDFHSSSKVISDLQSQDVQDNRTSGALAAASTESDSNDQGLDSSSPFRSPSQLEDQESDSGCHFDSHSTKLRPKDSGKDSGCNIIGKPSSVTEFINRPNQLELAMEEQSHQEIQTTNH